MPQLDPRRTVDLAADRLRREILQGERAPGERLPPERTLAATLGISRLTLRAALSHLEAEGLVRARQGSGVTVLDWHRTGEVALIPALIALGDASLLGPFLALRRAVAAEAVALASLAATDAQLDALQDLAERLAAEPDLEALAAGNLEFSRRVVALADNLPMTLLFNTVARVYEARPGLDDLFEVDRPEVRASFGQIVALLRAREPDRARHTVRIVLEALDAALVAHLEQKEAS